jgi:hypothetical protein
MPSRSTKASNVIHTILVELSSPQIVEPRIDENNLV